jgi:hypothetical protein
MHCHFPRPSLVFLLVLACCVSCSSSTSTILGRVPSPDGQSLAVVTIREAYGAAMPGPEPPKKTGCWAELAVTRNGATVFTTGFDDLGVNQSAPLALDLAWSPDSAKVAYRWGSQLRVIGTNGTSVNHDVAAGKSHISSYKWVGDNDLLILTKGVDESEASRTPWATRPRNSRAWPSSPPTNAVPNGRPAAR